MTPPPTISGYALSMAKKRKNLNFATHFKKNRELFEFLSVASRQQLKALCKQLPEHIVDLLASIARNVIENPSIELTQPQKRVLKLNKVHILQLAHRKNSLKRKQEILRHKGHIIIPHLVTPTLKLFNG